MIKRLLMIAFLICINVNSSFAMDEEIQKEIKEIIKNTMQIKNATAYDAKNNAIKHIAEKYNPSIRKCRYKCEIEYSRNRAKANNYSVFKTTEETNREAQRTASLCFKECSNIQNEANEYYQYVINYLEQNYNLPRAVYAMP